MGPSSVRPLAHNPPPHPTHHITRHLSSTNYTPSKWQDPDNNGAPAQTLFITNPWSRVSAFYPFYILLPLPSCIPFYPTVGPRQPGAARQDLLRAGRGKHCVSPPPPHTHTTCMQTPIYCLHAQLRAGQLWVQGHLPAGAAVLPGPKWSLPQSCSPPTCRATFYWLGHSPQTYYHYW